MYTVLDKYTIKNEIWPYLSKAERGYVTQSCLIDMVNEFKQNKERFDRISRKKGIFNYDPQVIQRNIEDQRCIQEIIRKGNNTRNSSLWTNRSGH